MEYYNSRITDALKNADQKVWANEHCLWTSIPKNGNMAFRNVCTKLKMYPVHYETITPPPETVCVVRNPIYRLFSGLGEFKNRKGKKKDIPSLLNELLDNPRIFDEHVEPQFVFIEGKTFTHILEFENIVEETLTVNYFNEHEDIVRHRIRDTKNTASKHFSGQDLDDLYQAHKPLVDKAIEKYYQLDMLLWENREKLQNKQITAENINRFS